MAKVETPFMLSAGEIVVVSYVEALVAAWPKGLGGRWLDVVNPHPFDGFGQGSQSGTYFFSGAGGGGAMRRIMRMRMRIVYRVFFRCPFSGHPATSFYQNLPCFSFVLRIYQCTCNVRHAKIALFQHFAATPQKCRLHLGSFTSKM